MTTTAGRGGGGHGGGHHGGGFGFPGVYYDPWVFYDVNPEGGGACADAHKKHVVGGQEMLSSGEGAVLFLLLAWWAIHEADKRVPR